MILKKSSKLIALSDLPDQLAAAFQDSSEVTTADGTRAGKLVEIQTYSLSRWWRARLVSALRSGGLDFRNAMGVKSEYSDELVSEGFVDSVRLIAWVEALGLDGDALDQRLSAVREPAAPRRESVNGVTTKQGVQAFGALIQTDLGRALANGMKWVKDARIRKGTPGGKHDALWDPVLLALALHERHRVSKSKLDKAFRDRSFLNPWRCRWDEHSEDLM